jgi:DNA-binding CsgD family transcriptional regulator
MQLLEREELLGTLQKLRQRASAGDGALLFVEGEAGIGKTSLLQTFCRQQKETPVHWGGCDALDVPRPLGLLFAIAAGLTAELQRALREYRERMQLFGAFLSAVAKPTLVVFEDLHWADEATLEFLRYVGRRIDRTHTLLIGSFRNDEVGPAHPLRMVLGDLAMCGARRVTVQPLSLEAIKQLVGEKNIDAEALHRTTGGNPFFVTEVLAIGGSSVPPTVRDAVLARAARLGASARAVLDAAAIAGPRVEPWLLGELAAAESDAIDECLDSGVLSKQDGMFVFRHELARRAVMDAITPTRLMNLHRLALRALLTQATASRDPTRLAHHAEGAASEEAVLKFAPEAAREAAVKSAHREAAQQLVRALRFAIAPTAQRAALLDDYASECQLTGLVSDASKARQDAATLWRDLGNTQRHATSLARLAHVLVTSGHNAEAEAIMREAVALIGSESDTAAAVTVRRWAAHLRLLDRDIQDAIKQGEMALRLAEDHGDQEAIVHCLNTVGTSMILDGRVDRGRARLEQSRRLAEQLHWDAWVADAFVNLGAACGEVYRFDLAEHDLRQGVEFCSERDLDFERSYQLAWQALVWMYRGRWTEVSGVAHVVLADQRSPIIARMTALIALGRLRARRGDTGVWEALDEAKDLMDNPESLQQVALLQAARAEAAWFEGRTTEATKEASVGLELALRKRHPWFTAELLFWCWQAEGSLPGGIPDYCAPLPFALEISGRCREAAAAWRELNCPFETARALGESEESAQREALSMFESFSARPMIERVRYKLRAAGGLHRRNSPAGLTSKEVEVLALLAQGLRNKEIGERLHRSARTIDHHLAAIFTKLDVSSRAEAVSAGYRLGVVATRQT